MLVKRLLLVLFLMVVVFVIWNRERLFVRDPLGSVTRGGVREAGVQVYINYSNDVLLEKDDVPMSLTLVQHGQRVGVPIGLKCLHYLVCRTDAAVSTMILERKFTVEFMSAKFVRYLGGDGVERVVHM
jgi:hypothetical protein